MDTATGAMERFVASPLFAVTITSFNKDEEGVKRISGDPDGMIVF